MQAPHKYPVGVQSFEAVRKEGCLYVDKTRYVYDMTHGGGSYYFLSRPRRFGKTLLVSTLEAYFQGRRELFSGLEIDGLEKEWRCHPVIRFDLSSVKTTDRTELEEQLSNLVASYERVYGRKTDSPVVSDRISAVVRAAAEQTGEQAVVLVDEYDAPLLNVLHDPARLEEFRQTMRQFYAPLKALEPQLRFVLLTGITKFSQLSVFSELNNMRNISMLPAYAGVCGITEDELRGQMAEDVAYLAEQLGLSPEAAYEKLAVLYDGYRFCWPSPGVYNPFSLVSALEDGQLSSYWFASGTPTSLVNLLKEARVDVTGLDAGVLADAYAFDAPAEGIAPAAFMYQAGYLTIKDFDAGLGSYTLGLPNGEVEEGFYRSLLPAYAGLPLDEQSRLVIAMARAVRGDDVEAALRAMRTFLLQMPYDVCPRREKDLQTVMFVMFKVLGSKVSAEAHVATGSIDLLLENTQSVYVMELKYGESSQVALNQIEAKGYALPFEAAGRRVVEVGLNFSPEERTIEEDWIIREV